MTFCAKYWVIGSCSIQRPVATTLINYMAGDACIAGDAYSVDAPGLAPWEFHVIPILEYTNTKDVVSVITTIQVAKQQNLLKLPTYT
jgi:hypothetical protein